MIAKVTGERRQGQGGQVDAANGDQKMPFLQFGRNYNVKFAIATRVEGDANSWEPGKGDVTNAKISCKVGDSFDHLPFFLLFKAHAVDLMVCFILYCWWWVWRGV